MTRYIFEIQRGRSIVAKEVFKRFSYSGGSKVEIFKGIIGGLLGRRVRHVIESIYRSIRVTQWAEGNSSGVQLFKYRQLKFAS